MPRPYSFAFLGIGILSTLALAQSAPQAMSQQPLLATASQGAERPSENSVKSRLTRVKTITSASEVSGGFVPHVRCDTDGNIYFHTLPDGGASSIHKLNSNGETVAVFEAGKGTDLNKIDVAADFSIRANTGEIYQIVYPHKMDCYVFVYGADGNLKSEVKLQPGFPFTPHKLAAFPTGRVLISGEEYDEKPGATMWPFTGIFSADGQLLKEIELGDERELHEMVARGDTRVAIPGANSVDFAIDHGQAEIGGDGNAYLMRWTNPAVFYVISSDGEVLRHFMVDPGNLAYRPSAMHIYQDHLAVLFVEMQSYEMIMKIIDLKGNELASYTEGNNRGNTADALGVTFACYTEDPRRFGFLGAGNDRKVQYWVSELR